MLKACIFATGLAGIVAEYVMATLASYLLGDAVLQWTLTVSLMLFAMGVGSRRSRFIHGAVLDAFVTVEVEGEVGDGFAAVLPDSVPFAFANPIFVDADGDGKWTAPGLPSELPPSLSAPHPAR